MTDPKGQVFFVFGKGVWFKTVNQRPLAGAKVILEASVARDVGLSKMH